MDANVSYNEPPASSLISISTLILIIIYLSISISLLLVLLLYYSYRRTGRSSVGKAREFAASPSGFKSRLERLVLTEFSSIKNANRLV